MPDDVRDRLASYERRARITILFEFQSLQQRMKKRFADLLEQIEMQRKEKGTVSVSFLFEQSRLAQLLADLNAEIRSMSESLSGSVTSAQSKAVDLANTEAEKLLSTQTANGQIVRLNPEAVSQFVGMTQNKTPISDLLKNLSKPVALKVKSSLIDGIATGSSAREVSRELNAALGTGAAHALTIARTELNSAFRSASLETYRNNSEIVKGYRFLSALDARTCVICWSYHGRILKLNKKPFLHVNCRCTISPVLILNEKFETGVEKFGKLEKGYQKQILGEKRFELFKQGTALAGFVADKQTEYGLMRVIKNLDDL